MKRKGFYIKQGEKCIYLNLFKEDFINYINAQPGEWIKFSIYEKMNDPKGFTHNMDIIAQREREQNNPTKLVD